MAAATTREMTARSVTLVLPESLGYYRLYLDFIHNRQPARDFYPPDSPGSVLSSVDRRDYPRDQLVEVLNRQNEVFGLSDTTRANIELLRDKRSACVFAGQQAGLFGGPLFTLIKGLAIVKTARLYTEKLGRPVIPIFWIAGDDHDFAEANHTFVHSRKGEVSKLEYATPPSQPVPAGEIRFDDRQELTRVLDQLSDILGQTEFTSSLLTTMRRCYTPNDTMVTAFGKFMAAIAGESGLVLFNPADPEVKRLATPFFEQVVEKQPAISKSVILMNERLRQSDYHVQVEKKENAVHLFCNQGGRRPVIRDGDGYLIEDRRATRTELKSLLDEHPEAFSTDVLTRPMLQSWLFPVLMQVGGPSEIAYFAQVNSLFELFDLPAPVYRARPSLTLVERRSAQLMQDLGIAFEDLLGDVEQVVNRVLAETFPADIEGRFSDFRKEIEERFRQLADEVVSFDAALQGMAEQTRGKIDFLLNGLEAKVFAAHKKRSQETRERIYRLSSVLYPQRVLQERCLNITYFLARYGAGIVTYIYEHMNSEETAHQLLSLSDYEP
jgi:bacillithiol biosynthesis cysteine-adding enzyme BshC